MSHDWSRRWRFTGKPAMDFMTRRIAEVLLDEIPEDAKSVLEIGCGTGRLSYLLMQKLGAKFTLIDPCEKAVEIASRLMSGYGKDRVEIFSDPSQLQTIPHDVVFSSGLVEHFKGSERVMMVQNHVWMANRLALIVHPSNTVWADIFNSSLPAKWLYGYQQAFSVEEMNACLFMPEVRCVTHDRFHPFYTVPGLHNVEWLNRACEPFLRGGLTLTTIEVEPWCYDDNFSHP